MRLIIDQLAIRGGQFERFVNLVSTPSSVIYWGQGLPNIEMSLALALYKLRQTEEAEQTLREAALKWPWMFSRLCKELDIEPIPKSVWGLQTKNPNEDLLASIYAIRAKDIWNTPDGLSFLKDVLNSMEERPKNLRDPFLEPSEPEMFNLARHILLSENPALISLIPRWVTERAGSSSDPLPPSDDLPSYNLSDEVEREEWEEELAADEREVHGIQSWLTSIVGRLGINMTNFVGNSSNNNDNDTDDFPVEQFAEALQNSGVDINELTQRTHRLHELRERQVSAEQRLRELETGLNNIDGRLQALDDDAVLAEALAQSRIDDRLQALDDNAALSRLSAEAREEFTAIAAPPGAWPPTTGPESRTSSTSTPTPPPLSSDEINALITTSTTAAASTSGREPYDDESNQRWLAGRGMLRLKDFIAAHGADENAWKDDLDVDVTPATEYAHRITLLRTRQAREYILNYALKQGAGAEASQLIRRLAGV